MLRAPVSALWTQKQTLSDVRGGPPSGQELALTLIGGLSMPLRSLWPPSPLPKLCREKLNKHFHCPLLLSKVFKSILNCLCFKIQNLNPYTEQLTKILKI